MCIRDSLETPQNFRKRLYPKSGLLQFVGALSPVKMPNQTVTSDAKQVKKGDIREGVIFPKDGKKFIDIGIDHSIPYHGKKQIDKRAIIKIKDTFPNSFQLVFFASSKTTLVNSMKRMMEIK